jgi:hypothetical protein
MLCKGQSVDGLRLVFPEGGACPNRIEPERYGKIFFPLKQTAQRVGGIED